ncbi:MAG: biotin/lipoyl-containing protein [Parolsenella sp.]|uniref:biotin/lipoyl-containing protein n=1 Tax=Parolsenella sp. TaxID=2083006 RepID=UPI002E7A69D2|nr:biotin/lipoyl-containing protein [Parolsenella sp.]MEE1373059.1 biotin/lipoyl-containing protein [Parolsenella sp.]
MLRKFKIKIDGTEYLVEMEELTEPGSAPAPVAAPAAPAPAPAAPAPAAPAPAPAPAPTAAAPAPAPAPAAPAGADAQTAPMPGKILELKHNVGDVVAQNDCVLVLEAMKMENAIVAERAGTISAIHVTAGQMVNPGDALFTIS